MKLRVYGASRSLSPEETRYALEWAGVELLGSRLMSSISVNFRWKKFPDEKGHCEWQDSNHMPRKFSLACNPQLSRRTQLRTLFHEMVHVKQYARSEMKSYIITDRFTRWKKILVDEERIPYTRLPWEREAYRLEKVLYDKYVEHLRLAELNFS